MPCITQGRRQWIVSTETLLAWKRFEQEHSGGLILARDANGALVVMVIADGSRWRVFARRHVVEESH